MDIFPDTAVAAFVFDPDTDGVPMTVAPNFYALVNADGKGGLPIICFEQEVFTGFFAVDKDLTAFIDSFKEEIDLALFPVGGKLERGGIPGDTVVAAQCFAQLF